MNFFKKSLMLGVLGASLLVPTSTQSLDALDYFNGLASIYGGCRLMLKFGEKITLDHIFLLTATTACSLMYRQSLFQEEILKSLEKLEESTVRETKHAISDALLKDRLQASAARLELTHILAISKAKLVEQPKNEQEIGDNAEEDSVA